MQNGSTTFTGIPIFLRRPSDRTPAKLAIKRPKFKCALPPLPSREMVIHGGTAPVVPDFIRAQEEAPVQTVPVSIVPIAAQIDASQSVSVPNTEPVIEPASQSAPQSEVVDLTAHRSAGADPQPVKMYKDLRAAFDADQDEIDENDDAAFQVTLPRSVIRQIRVVAAEEGTTHRAIVLRALRAAGLDIPEGADVDRRVLAAKRRQQA